MWSQAQGPPPAGGPPPPMHGGHQPTPPGAYGGPPPPQQGYHGGGSYEDEDSDDGALSSTINLVTSAATMFFKPSSAPAPPPPQPQQQAPLQRGPPPPIDPTTSMLDMDPTPTTVPTLSTLAPPLASQSLNPYSAMHGNMTAGGSYRSVAAPLASSAPPPQLSTIGSYDSQNRSTSQSVPSQTRPGYVAVNTTQQAWSGVESSPLATSEPRVVLTASPLLTSSPRVVVAAGLLAGPPMSTGSGPPTPYAASPSEPGANMQIPDLNASSSTQVAPLARKPTAFFGGPSGVASNPTPAMPPTKPPTPTASQPPALGAAGGAPIPKGRPLMKQATPPPTASTGSGPPTPSVASPSGPGANMQIEDLNAASSTQVAPPAQKPTAFFGGPPGVASNPTPSMPPTKPPQPTSTQGAPIPKSKLSMKRATPPPSPRGPPIVPPSGSQPPTPLSQTSPTNAVGVSTSVPPRIQRMTPPPSPKPAIQGPTATTSQSLPPTPTAQPSPKNTMATSSPPLSANQPPPVQRATPPPSPKVAVVMPSTPTTPLRTNQTVSASTPSTSDRRLPTPSSSTASRRLRPPPKAQHSPRSARPKFRLPPPRKTKVAPSPSATIKSTSSMEAKTAPAPSPRHVEASLQQAPPEVETPTLVEATPSAPLAKKLSPPAKPSVGTTPAAVASLEPPKAGSLATQTPKVSVKSMQAEHTEVNEEEKAPSLSDQPWQEVADPSSGRTYYYNAKTQETSWENPVVPATVPPMEPKAVEETKPAVEEPAKEETPAASEQEAKEEEPAVGKEHTEKLKPAADSDSLERLPVDWVETTDPSTGQVYYYNTCTHATSWHRPVVEAAPSTVELLLEQKEESIASTFAALDAVFGVDKKDEKAEENSGKEEVPEPTKDEAEEPAAESTPVASEHPQPEVQEDASLTSPSVLPTDWIDVVDPASGNKYYYNTKTQETAWELPQSVSESSVETKEVPEDAAVQEQEKKELPEDAPVQEQEAEPDPEGIGKEEQVAPSTVEDTMETTKEVSSSLPVGWSEVSDPSSGQNYYYNSVTQETSWEPPQFSSSTDSVNAEGMKKEEAKEPKPPTEDNLANKTLEEIALEVAEATEFNEPAKVSSLPRDWKEITDPSSGVTYYYNEQKQETSWERPGFPDVLADTVSERDEPHPTTALDEVGSAEMPSEPNREDDEVRVETENVDPVTEEITPSDVIVGDADARAWSELVDPLTGQTYYYNTVTQESSWEKPAELGEVPVENDEFAGSKQGSELLTPDTDAPVEPEPDQEPPQDEVQKSADKVVLATDVDGLDSTPGLPINWVEAEDPSNGQLYYYNTETGESSWERPSQPDHQEQSTEPEAVPTAVNPESVGTEILDETESTAGPADQPGHDAPVAITEATALPPDWVETVDPSSNGKYYYNTATQETLWDRPSWPKKEEEKESEEVTEASDGVATDSSDNSKDDVVSGEGYESSSESEDEDNDPSESSDEDKGSVSDWVPSIDPSTQKRYYYNSMTGEVSWEKPEGFVEDETEDPSNGEENESEEEVTESTEALAGYQENCEANPERGGDTDEWKKETDPQSGQTYYFNIATNQTSWEKPESLQAVDNKSRAVGEEIDGQNDGNEALNGWVEASDPSSGRTYYRNEVTGETSWEKPNVGEKNAEEPLAEEATKTSMEDKAEEENENPRGESLASDYEVLDKAENNDADFEIVTVEDASPAPQPVPPLPEFWTEASDPDSGQTYYFNTLTQETSWDRPRVESDAKAKIPDGELSSEATERTTEKGAEPQLDQDQMDEKDEATPEERQDDCEYDLPPKWTEVQDPHTGHTYYYNSETHETSWDRPDDKSSVLASQDQLAKEQTVDDTTSSGAASAGDVNKADDQATLPAGWTKEADPNTNDVYYFNSETGETSWDPPTSEATDQIADPLLEAGGEQDEPTDAPPEDVVAMASEQDDDLNESSRLPGHWTEMVDPQSGQTYFYNENTDATSWERPVTKNISSLDEFQSTDGTKSTTAGNASERQDVVDSNAMGGGLPKDWERINDENAGGVYFYNSKTGETSWDPPQDAGSPVDDKSDEGKFEENTAMGAEGKFEKNTAMDAEGRFEENTATGAKEANTTSGQSDGKSVGEEGDDTRAMQLLDGWVELVDPSSGATYFYNEENKTTSWDRPVASHETKADVPEESAKGKETETAVETSPVMDGAETEASDGADLPGGWVVLTDPSSQQAYYFNEQTNETSWEKPHAKGIEETNTSDVDIGPPTKEIREEAPADTETLAESSNIEVKNESTNDTSWGKPTKQRIGSGQAEVQVLLGFGGTICKLVSQPPKISVECDSQANFEKCVKASEEERRKCGIIGPLNEMDDETVMLYIDRKKEQAEEDLLWKLIAIAARSNGRLRSVEGVCEPTSPERSIVELLLQGDENFSKPNRSQYEKKSSPKNDKIEEQSVEKVESLLLRGNRREAVYEAISCRDFATAFLVASMCDGDTYKRTASEYARTAFVSGSPMHTVAMLLSGGLQSSGSSGGHWGVDPEELKKTWKRHLAAIISNRTAGWDTIVLSLGDRLKEIGELQASHFCYMVCGSPLGAATKETTRVSLLGCPHAELKNISLMTKEAVAAFDRTEAYEWAKRRGNRIASIKSFQAFKVIYASILCDLNLTKSAEKHVHSLRMHLSHKPAVKLDASSLSTLSCMFEDSDYLSSALLELELQLGCVAEPTESSKSRSTSQLPIQSLPVNKAREHTKKGPENGSRTEGTFIKQGEKLPSKSNAQPQTAEALQLDKSRDADATFISAKSNLMDVSGFTLGSDEKPSKPSPLQSLQEKIPVEVQTEPAKQQAPPQIHSKNKIASTPQTKGMIAPPVGAMTPQDSKISNKLKSPPNTAPPVMTGKTPSETPSRKPAPASSEKRTSWGIRQRLVKWINPDATEVNLPENEEKAYYDEKRKVWVFPGQNPDEVAKPIGPPPTTPSAASVPKAASEPVPAPPNDPLAAMMAPPTFRRPGAGRGAGTPRGYRGMPSPGMPSPAVGGAAPPQFAVFTPKPDKSKEEDN